MADRGHSERNCSNFFMHWLKKTPKPPEQVTQQPERVYFKVSTLGFTQASLYCTMLPSRVKGLVCLLLVPGDRPQTLQILVWVCAHIRIYTYVDMERHTFLNTYTWAHLLTLKNPHKTGITL